MHILFTVKHSFWLISTLDSHLVRALTTNLDHNCNALQIMLAEHLHPPIDLSSCLLLAYSLCLLFQVISQAHAFLGLALVQLCTSSFRDLLEQSASMGCLWLT